MKLPGTVEQKCKIFVVYVPSKLLRHVSSSHRSQWTSFSQMSVSQRPSPCVPVQLWGITQGNVLSLFTSQSDMLAQNKKPIWPSTFSGLDVKLCSFPMFQIKAHFDIVFDFYYYIVFGIRK